MGEGSRKATLKINLLLYECIKLFALHLRPSPYSEIKPLYRGLFPFEHETEIYIIFDQMSTFSYYSPAASPRIALLPISTI